MPGAKRRCSRHARAILYPPADATASRQKASEDNGEGDFQRVCEDAVACYDNARQMSTFSTQQVLDELDPTLTPQEEVNGVSLAAGTRDMPGLFGRVETQWLKDSRKNVQEEKPWHRHAALLYMKGYQVKQIAEETGYCTTTVSQLLHSPRFNVLVATLIERNGGKDLIESFKTDAAEAHNVLVSILHNDKAALSLRAKVATDMIERVYGKATQRIEHGEIRSDDPVGEVERLRKEVADRTNALLPSLS